MKEYLITQICPQDLRAEAKAVLFFSSSSGSTTQLRLKPPELWGAFNTEVKVGSAQARTVKVPDLQFIVGHLLEAEPLAHEQFASCFRRLAEHHCPDLFGRVGERWSARGVQLADLLEVFERMPQHSQESALVPLKELLAVYLLIHDVYRRLLEEKSDEYRDGTVPPRVLTPKFPDESPSQHYERIMDELSQVDWERFAVSDYCLVYDCMRELAAERISVFYGFLDVFYWEEAILPRNAVRSFLPPELWPEAVVPGLGDGSALRLSRRRASTEQIDPERFRFYRDVLGCKRVVEPEGEFKKRDYVAFLLKSKSGERFAILDCKLRGNAIYLFRIDESEEPDSADWLVLAQQSKRAVLTTEGRGGPFIRRIFHSEDWTSRVKRFLDSN